MLADLIFGWFIISRTNLSEPGTTLTPVVAWAAGTFALIGWVVQAWVNLRNTRKQHSINVLFNSRMSAEFQRFQKAISDQYGIGAAAAFETHPPAAISTAITSPDDIAAENKRMEAGRAVTFFLNYYEFIAVGIWHGDLDHSILRDTIRGQLTNFCDRADALITENRKRNSLLYINLLRLKKRWAWPASATGDKISWPLVIAFVSMFGFGVLVGWKLLHPA